MRRPLLATATFVALVQAALLTATSEAAAIINFETVSAGTSVPFSVTAGGVATTFTGAGNFHVDPIPGLSPYISGQALFNSDASGLPLSVSFDSLLTSISLGFAVNTRNDTTPFTLTALSGGTTVGIVTVLGTLPPGFEFSGGTIGFSGAAFDNIQFSSGASDFAVDDITINAVVPEPASLLLFASGLAGLAARTRARRRRQL